MSGGDPRLHLASGSGPTLAPCPLPPALVLLLPVLLVQDSARADRDSVERGRTLVLPVVGYSEVTGVQYGATAFRSHRPAGHLETRASTEAVYVARTVEGYAKAYAQAERWSVDNALLLRGRADYRSYPLPYFGIGPSVPDSAEEWYSSGVLTLQADAQQEVRRNLYAIAGWRLLRSHMREVEPDRALDLETIPGSSGGTVSEARAGMAYDSRDHPVAPRQGIWARVLLSTAADALGSSFAFSRLTMDARRYDALAHGFTLALQAQVDGVDGTVPFDLLPMIGADSAMRGYDRGRYRDRAAATTQVEVRSPHWRRAGFVVFAGAGTVSRRLADLASGTWYPTVGAGLRVLVSPANRTALRLDLAFGRGTVGVNAGIGEAF